jgi:Domain of unknown function (DUF4249)
MKKNIVKYIALTSLLNFVSCGSFNGDIVKIEPQKSQIVVFAEVFNDEKWNQAIVLSRTRNFNQVFDFDFTYGDTVYVRPDSSVIYNNFFPPLLLDTVKGAKIKLFSDSKVAADFTQTDPFLKSFYRISNLNLGTGSLCKLQISAPDFDTIFAEQSIPKSVKLLKASFIRNSYQSQKNGILSEVILDFDNDPSIINYYTVDIYIKKYGQAGFSYIKPNTIKIDLNADTPQFLSSKNFNSNRYSWRIGVDLGLEKINYPIPNDYVDMLIIFRSTSRDYIEYAKNLEATKNAGDNLFGEPITPYSNIKNGFGVFVVSGKPDSISLSIR